MENNQLSQFVTSLLVVFVIPFPKVSVFLPPATIINILATVVHQMMKTRKISFLQKNCLQMTKVSCRKRWT